MDFRTAMKLTAGPLRLTPASRALMFGSCFAEHVGRRLCAALPDGHVEVNPFGVLYNPASVADALDLLLDESRRADDALFCGRDGMWHSLRHAGCVSATTREVCAATVGKRLDAARKALRRADVLCATFGTARAYRHKASGIIAANCHKEPAADFEELELDVEETVSRWCALIDRLQQANGRLRLVFTVSPYRYIKYGLHGSQLTKARLLLAIDEICRRRPQALYFPAYELVVDDLRDYRFYDTDMLHPSEQAVDYVWAHFGQWAFTPELHEYAREKAAIARDDAHRPLHPDSEAARQFAKQREARRKAFAEKWKPIIETGKA